ncbi:hypothetical protein [Micromonospora sp. DT227]|uniref:hypothetical protein n=1 Tax=Micromonospora sp. DT227 TaxID=3393433 RepID=UPI003CEF7F36
MAELMLTYRRAVAALIPAPGLSRCSHCGMPWGEGNRRGRTVSDRFDELGRARGGTFVVCLWCWPQVPADMLLFYAAGLVLGVWPLVGVPLANCVRDWPRVRAAYEQARRESTVRCPHCGDPVDGLLAGCSKTACLAVDIADDHRQARREDV